MDLTVNRTNEAWDGIFGEIPELNLVTLEHAYGGSDGTFKPKVPQGRYTCVRGQHTLPTGEQIETFEVTNVTGHSGILFHPGNYNQDSAGCFLLGIEIASNNRQRFITTSRLAFHAFLDAQEGCDQFILTVNDPVVHNNP